MPARWDCTTRAHHRPQLALLPSVETLKHRQFPNRARHVARFARRASHDGGQKHQAAAPPKLDPELNGGAFP